MRRDETSRAGQGERGEGGREEGREGKGRGGVKRNEKIKRNASGALAQKSKAEFESIFLNLFIVEGYWARGGGRGG